MMPTVHPLRNYRLSQQPRISQRELADRLSVSRVTVARWETGRRRIDEEKIQKIAKLTGISPSVLRPDLAELMAPPKGKLPRADVSDPPF